MVKRRPRWGALVLGTLCALLGGLSVHVILQQVLHVPHPSSYPAKVWLEQVDQATIPFGLLLLLSWSPSTLGRLGFFSRWLSVFVLYAMLRESLRAALMEGVVTTAYGYPLLTLAPKLLSFLLLTLMCVAFQPWLPRLWQKLFGAAFIYALTTYVAQPVVTSATSGLLSRFAYLQHDEVYPMPYGRHVLVPAYLSFIEPVVACILFAALLGRDLPRQFSRPWIAFAFLMLLLRRSLFPPFIYALYQPGHRGAAVLSAGQFSLETIALALLSAWTYRFALRNDESV